MLELLFICLILIASISISIFSYFYDKRNILFVIVFFLFSVFCLYYYWQLSVLVLLSSIFIRSQSFSRFISFNIFSAILLGWFFLNLFMIIETPIFLSIALLSVVVICILGIFGIFESKLRRFLLLSTAIQIIFIILHLSVGKMFGEMGFLGTIEIFNYTFAGLVLFLTIGIFGRNKVFVYDLEGSFYTNKWNDAFATIACLSLAGLPAFNMFVPKWELYTVSFAVAPMITLLGIFTALILFVMYYKLVYVLLVGEGNPRKIPIPITALNGILAIICVVLGLLPQLQWTILGAFS